MVHAECFPTWPCVHSIVHGIVHSTVHRRYDLQRVRPLGLVKVLLDARTAVEAQPSPRHPGRALLGCRKERLWRRPAVATSAAAGVSATKILLLFGILVQELLQMQLAFKMRPHPWAGAV